MYKDKDKQREANRKAMQRSRNKVADNLMPGYKEGYDKAIEIACDTPSVIPSDVIPERTAQGNIRVSKPGDDDYVPQCETMMVFVGGKNWVDELGRSLTRGKDIKCFADLPPDVQETIRKMSMLDGKLDETIKANRTAIAVNYQHLFPERYHSTGVAI